MTRTFVLLLTMAFFGLAAYGAADNPAAGKWDCTSTDERGTQMPWTLTVKEDGGKLSGSVVGQDGDAIPLIDTKFEGNALTFKIRINEQETVAVEVKIDGKKFEGTFKGKDSGTGTFKGAK